MDKEKLYQDLKGSVTEEHLKEMTLQILQAQQQGNIVRYLPLLQRLTTPPIETEQILDITRITERQIFLRLLRYLHPDRCSAITSRITEAYEQDQGEILSEYRNILGFTASTFVYEAPQENSTYEEEDFDESDTYQEVNEQWFEDEVITDFITACKAELTGNMDRILDPGDLLNLSGELVISGYQIDDLDGLAYCEAITVLNLSHNAIINLYDLKDLKQLQELDLSCNEIEDISHLSELIGLQVLDISHNEVDDLTPLLPLYDLQYLNISGNPCSRDVRNIEILSERGVIIISF